MCFWGAAAGEACAATTAAAPPWGTVQTRGAGRLGFGGFAGDQTLEEPAGVARVPALPHEPHMCPAISQPTQLLNGPPLLVVLLRDVLAADGCCCCWLLLLLLSWLCLLLSQQQQQLYQLRLAAVAKWRGPGAGTLPGCANLLADPGRPQST